MPKIDLTDKERYILRLAAWVEFEPDWRQLYILSRDKIYKSLPPTLSQIVSNWKNSYIVKDFYKNERERYLRFLDSIRAEAVEASRTEGAEDKSGGISDEGTKTKKGHKTSKPDQVVNFQDRDEFIKYLERRANEITDEKLKFDYLKTLADLMQYKKDSEDSAKKEIQRFYMPLSCQNCKLYQDQRQKVKNEQNK